jgi:HKD family nuclease
VVGAAVGAANREKDAVIEDLKAKLDAIEVFKAEIARLLLFFTAKVRAIIIANLVDELYKPLPGKLATSRELALGSAYCSFLMN